MIGRTNTGGGGGGGLNFKVVGNPKPSNPKGNVIWVNTDVKITGYYFSAEQPENMVNGDVWFPTGTSSTVEFNALKKNVIQVYPLEAKQYVNGAWVNVKAYSYQDSKWVEWWNGELYTPGNMWENVTGGWYNARNANLTSTESGMVVKYPGSGESSAIAMQKGTEVDFSGHSVLYVTIDSFVSSGGSSSFSICFRQGTSVTSTKISEKSVSGGVASETTYELAIPNNAVKALFIFVYQGTLSIKKIWME